MFWVDIRIAAFSWLAELSTGSLRWKLMHVAASNVTSVKSNVCERKSYTCYALLLSIFTLTACPQHVLMGDEHHEIGITYVNMPEFSYRLLGL
jgi:hypothetical protein